ncbi:MAG: hypothetical protein GYB50_10595 [Rhodobacteraceae bacterium]|nr:hypothetical protein [Paracoccaceae bacterium]
MTMCLTAQALFLFLSVLPEDIVDVSPKRVVVHAEVRDAVWLPRDDQWCTDAPRRDADIRLQRGTAL